MPWTLFLIVWQFIEVNVKVLAHPILRLFLHSDSAAHTVLDVTFNFFLLVNRHVEAGIAWTKDVSNVETFRCVASRLEHEFLQEIYRGHITSCEEAANHWQLDTDSLTAAVAVWDTSEHLLACLAAIILALTAEEADLDVVNFNFWDDSAGTF